MPTMSMSASGGKADIPDTPHRCPLMTLSGHGIWNLTEPHANIHLWAHHADKSLWSGVLPFRSTDLVRDPARTSIIPWASVGPPYTNGLSERGPSRRDCSARLMGRLVP